MPGFSLSPGFAIASQSNGPAPAAGNETFHCSPCIEQSYSAVVDDVAVLISRVLLVSRLKCKRSMNEVEVQISEAESVQTRLESRFDTLRPMIGVPHTVCLFCPAVRSAQSVAAWNMSCCGPSFQVDVFSAKRFVTSGQSRRSLQKNPLALSDGTRWPLTFSAVQSMNPN